MSKTGELAEQGAAAVPVLRALADPVRFDLVALIAARPGATAGELGAGLPVSQPTISHHLKALFDAGLVVRSRLGTTVSYRVNPAALAGVATLLTGLADGQDGSDPGPARWGRARRPLASGAADQVLRRGVEELAYRFAGVFAVETVDRAARESYQALYGAAKVKTYVPVLALRFAEERLTALAQAEGTIAKPLVEVLLVCTRNAGRSQLAAGFLRTLGQGRVHVRSAGSAPADQVSPAVVQVMAERGIDLTGEFPKPLTDDVLHAADVVVTMGCGDACPLYPGKRYLDWDLSDPEGQPLETVRGIADAVERKVRQLLTDIASLEK